MLIIKRRDFEDDRDIGDKIFLKVSIVKATQIEEVPISVVFNPRRQSQNLRSEYQTVL
jgi:hypothetical protein